VSARSSASFSVWFHESERFAGSIVQALRNELEIVLAVDTEIGALGHVLTQEPIRVAFDPLCQGLLPGTVRITEVDGDPGADAELAMPRELFALVPDDAPEESSGKASDGRLHRGVDHDRLTSVGQVESR